MQLTYIIISALAATAANAEPGANKVDRRADRSSSAGLFPDSTVVSTATVNHHPDVTTVTSGSSTIVYTPLSIKPTSVTALPPYGPGSSSSASGGLFGIPSSSTALFGVPGPYSHRNGTLGATPPSGGRHHPTTTARAGSATGLAGRPDQSASSQGSSQSSAGAAAGPVPVVGTLLLMLLGM